MEVLFQINRQRLEILHLLREHFGVEPPADAAAEQSFRQKVARLEDEAKQLEAELGASAE